MRTAQSPRRAVVLLLPPANIIVSRDSAAPLHLEGSPSLDVRHPSWPPREARATRFVSDTIHLAH